ncbi:MAG: cation-translocating P-type ATPase [Anaerolineales bacterium]|jgi:Ca2+-transporting ATPase
MTTEPPQATPPTAWHALPPEFVFARQNTDPDLGLSEAEAAQRLAQSGLNRRGSDLQSSIWQDVRQRFTDPQLLAGLAAGAALAALGELTAGIITWLLVLALGTLQIIRQRQAQRALEALQVLNEPAAIVRRGGRRQVIPADEVVPGDLILLEAGQRVPAEARLVQGYSLQTDESALSGDSQPVDKTTDAFLPNDTPLDQRVTMVYPGTLVVRGQADAVVTATGAFGEPTPEAGPAVKPQPQIGAHPTPLQSDVRVLGRKLLFAALAVSAALALLAGLRSGLTVRGSLLTGLALIFATLPGQSLLLVSILLALGAYRMAHQHAAVRSLEAVETLAVVNTVVTETSGLLTTNQLTFQRSVPPIWERQLLEIGVMATGVDLGRFRAGNLPAGELPDLRGTDPVDAALLQAAAAVDVDILGLRTHRPLEEVFTYDAQRRRMSVVYRRGARPFVAVKGDPEAVLGVCVRRWTRDGIDNLTPIDRQAILKTTKVLASSGGRVIALAERALDKPNGRRIHSPEDVERELNFAGFLAFNDHIRPETAKALQTCRQAGIRVLLVTGDQPAATQILAEQVGLTSNNGLMSKNGLTSENELVSESGLPSKHGLTADTGLVSGAELDRLDNDGLAASLRQHEIFARITPLQKLRIIRSLQAQGACITVTGNQQRDTLALSAANLGAALGQSGTDAARSAASLVLVDDNFSSLVRAIAAGRHLYRLILHSLGTSMAAKLGLVSTLILPIVFALPLPFNPLQIIIAGFLCETLILIAMVHELVDKPGMRIRPYTPRRALLDAPMQARIFRGAISLFTSVTLAYLSSLLISGNLIHAQTTAFVTYLLTYVLVVYSLRSDSLVLLRQNLLSNRVLLAGSALVAAFALAVTQVPVLMQLAGTNSLHPMEWALVLFSVLVGITLSEIRKWLGAIQGSKREG